MTVEFLEASEALAAARLKPGRDERAQGAKEGDVGRAFAKEAGAGAERLIGQGAMRTSRPSRPQYGGSRFRPWDG